MLVYCLRCSVILQRYCITLSRQCVGRAGLTTHVGVLKMSENQHKKRRTFDVEAANTQKCRKIYPVISSIRTEPNFHTVPCVQNVRSKLSASRKFVLYRVNVA